MTRLLLNQIIICCLLLTEVCFAQNDGLPGANSTLLMNRGGQNNILKGVARLYQNHKCTGVLIDVGGNANSPAYVISNGHCAQEWDANKVFTNVPLEGYHVLFNYFIDQREHFDTVQVKKIAYSSMKGTDISILELNTTIAKLRAKGVEPFKIAQRMLKDEQEITLITAPAGPIPSDSIFLRKIDCEVKGTANLFEHFFHFDNLYKTNCLDVYGGGSGSPVFDRDNYDEVFGLLNTTTIEGSIPCAFGAPCELTKEGTTFIPNTSYVVPISGVANCFNENGVFDLTASDCPLPNQNQIWVKDFNLTSANSKDRSGERKRWGIKLQGPLKYYRYKIGLVGKSSPLDGDGYSKVKELQQDSVINEFLPLEEGRYILSVQGGNSKVLDRTWQPLKEASVVILNIDNTPPENPPSIRTNLATDSLVVRMNYSAPDHSRFELKYDIARDLDCDDDEGYVRYNWRNPPIFSVKDLPCKICVKAFDDAENSGNPTKLVVDIKE